MPAVPRVIDCLSSEAMVHEQRMPCVAVARTIVRIRSISVNNTINHCKSILLATSQ